MEHVKNRVSASGPHEDAAEMSDEDMAGFLAGIDRGLAQSARGEYIPGDEVFKWMESWGRKMRCRGQKRESGGSF